jgi:hypothetical protein
MSIEKEKLIDLDDEKKVDFETKQDEEMEDSDDGSKKGGRKSSGYELKIAVSQRQYTKNKKNSSLYSAWSFIPVNLYHQLLNPVFQFYLIIMILELIPQVSITNGVPNTMIPYSIVILIQMIADYFIYFKVNNLDWIQNNMRVSDFQN